MMLVCCWATWFFVIGGLKFFLIMCQERYNLTTSGRTLTPDALVHFKFMVGLLISLNCILAVFCVSTFMECGISVIMLLLFENIVVFMGCAQVSFLLYAHVSHLPTEQSLPFIYNCNFFIGSSIQICTLIHFLHVWYFYGFSATIIDIFILVNMRNIIVKLMKRFREFQQYRKTMKALQESFPDASATQLQGQSCAICLDDFLGKAKCLPCQHLFHISCIQPWLSQHPTCPICRTLIFSQHHNSTSTSTSSPPASAPEPESSPPLPEVAASPAQTLTPATSPAQAQAATGTTGAVEAPTEGSLGSVHITHSEGLLGHSSLVSHNLDSVQFEAPGASRACEVEDSWLQSQSRSHQGQRSTDQTVLKQQKSPTRRSTMHSNHSSSHPSLASYSLSQNRSNSRSTSDLTSLYAQANTSPPPSSVDAFEVHDKLFIYFVMFCFVAKLYMMCLIIFVSYLSIYLSNNIFMFI